MNILPLGVGGALTDSFFHNNFIFHLNGKRLLVDVGTTIRYSLKHAGLNYTDIDAIFITHFHSDHVGGLEEFLQRCYFRLENGVHTPHKPILIMLEDQVSLFEHALKIGLCTNGLKLEDFCEIRLIKGSATTLFGHRLCFINTDNLHMKDMSGYALSVTSLQNGNNVLFSSDIKHLNQSSFLSHIDEQTKAIFQDVQLYEVKNGVHAELDDILSFYPVPFHEKIYVMHYSDDISTFDSLLEGHHLKKVEQGKLLTF